MLDSWNDGAARAAILSFVDASALVTDPEPILATADRFGWTVVSMRRDWNQVFV